MTEVEDSRYRGRLSEGFLEKATDDARLKRWRSCVDNSQLAVENAAKSVWALLGPVGHTRGTADPLRKAVDSKRFSSPVAPQVLRLIELAEQLGWDAHVTSDYGDEVARRTPWELLDETAARQALSVAEEAVILGLEVVEAVLAP